MKVTIEELEQITKLVLSRLKKATHNELEISAGYYWEIGAEERYNPSENPKNLTLGDIAWDIENLRRLSKDQNNLIYYDIERLGNVFAAISNEVKKELIDIS
jgi:hypothetical protein